mgnify:FL=1
MPRPKRITAPRLLIYINSRLWGVVTSFTMRSATPRRKVKTIDVMHAQELMPTTYDVSFTMGIIRVGGDGGIQGAGLIARQQHLAREKYFSILVRDRLLDLPFFASEMNSVEDESWSVNAKGLLEGTVMCTGVVWTNETNQLP